MPETKKRLSRKPGTPLHQQAEARLRTLIAEEPFASGKENLTDEVTLAKKWGISRNTLRQAIARLVSEGRLRRVAGLGTRVLPAPVRSSATAWTSFTREMRERGIVVKNFHTTLEKLTAPEEVAGIFGLPAGSDAWRLRRVRGWNDQPAIVAESWLPPHLALPAAEEFHRHPLYEVLQEIAHLTPSKSQEDIRAVGAPEEMAQALDLKPGDPVLLRRRVILDTEDKPLEVNLNWYRSDRYALTLELKAH